LDEVVFADADERRRSFRTAPMRTQNVYDGFNLRGVNGDQQIDIASRANVAPSG
jgi:hypothetical protein